MRFSYTRALALGKSRRIGRRIEVTPLLRASINVAATNVRCIVSKHLYDMSLHVVDFGSRRYRGRPTEAVIAVGSSEQLNMLKRSLRVA